MAMSCIFCEIVSGERPASRIWEDEQCVAFMDLHPISAAHILIVPRRHAVLLTDLEPQVRRRLFEVACAARAAAASAGYGVDGANLLVNDGVAANQHIRHVHVHVVPREPRDGARVSWAFLRRGFNSFGGGASRQELDRMADVLRPLVAAFLPRP
jgi:histidine triad (HIT) family protein